MSACLVKADKDAFAVYQTIYSGADTNMQFDWDKRLEDTKWAEDAGYWVMLEGKRVDGILILDDLTRFPFLIEPFCDRGLFWRIVIRYLKENRPGIRNLYSVLDADIPVLLSYGYKIVKTRRMMCRPTEAFALARDERFTYHIPDVSKDLEAMTGVIVKGYEGGIDYLLDPGADEGETREEARADLKYFLEGYAATGTGHHSLLIRDRATGAAVALCVAGRHDKEGRPRFSSIADITVLPKYRGQGLAKAMIQNALSNAADTCDVMMLCVTVGNSAEGLYREMGFFGGPRFTNMTAL